VSVVLGWMETTPQTELDALRGRVAELEERLRRVDPSAGDPFASERSRVLHDANAKLPALILASPLPIVALDRNGLITLWNPAAERVFGWAETEVLGKLLPFIPEDKIDEHLAMRAQDLTGEGFANREVRRRRKDGTPIDISVSTAPIYDAKRRVAGIMSVYVDVTEQKKRVEDQRRSLEMFRIIEGQLMLLVDASGALLASPESAQVLSTILHLAQQFIQAEAYAVWRLHSEDEWKLVASTGLSERYERSVRSGAGTKIPDHIALVEDVEQAQWVHHRLDAYRAEGIRSMVSVPLRINNQVAGTIVFYYRSPHKFTDPETRIAGALGNLASAALGTAELYDRQAELRGLAEGAERRSSFVARVGQVLASSLDYETTLVSVTRLAVPSFADWCSVDIVDEGGDLRRLAVQHVDPAKVEFAFDYNARYPARENDLPQVAIRTGQAVMVAEIPESSLIASARDEEHLALIRALGLKSVICAPMLMRGRAVGLLTFVTSETERRYTASDLEVAREIARRAAVAIENARLFKNVSESEERFRRLNDSLRRTNEELRRANEDLNQFAYSASHDLQEPLRMIAIYTQLTARRCGDSLDPETREFMQYAIDGAQRMEMLLRDLLTYTQAVSIPADPQETVDSGEALQEALANIRLTIDATGATIQVGELPVVRAYRVHVVQLFQNLVGNAIKYRSAAPPLIAIDARPDHEPGRWLFSVRDNGIGIDPKYHQQVFGLFRRLYASRGYPGTGIGLAICQKVVERYGGRIWVESKEGHGATFFFTLPA